MRLRRSISPRRSAIATKLVAAVVVTVAAQAAMALRVWADDAPAPRRTVTAEVAQTRPAAGVEAVRRTLVWDRVKQEAEMAKQLADLQRSLKVAQDRAAAQPDDPTNKAVVAQAQRMLADAQQRLVEQQEALAKAHEAALVKAAYLGIATSPAPPVLGKQLKLADGMGLVVDFVEPGSPAEAAGVQPYDVAVRLNDQVLVNAPQLAVLVRTFDPGAEVTLTVIREGKETPLKVKLVERAVKPIADVAFGPMWANDVGWRRPLKVDRAAVPPTPQYVVAPGDILKVTIFDLEGPGLQTTVQSIVGQDGLLRLPSLKEPMMVRGSGQVEIQKGINDAYRKAGVDENANVIVQITPAADATVEMKMRARRDAQRDGQRASEPRRAAPQQPEKEY